MNYIELSLLITFIIVGVLTTIIFINYRKLKEKNKKITKQQNDFIMSKPPLTYEECKEILDIAIADVINDLNFRLEINEVKYIKDMKKDVSESTNEVFSLISKNVIEQFKCYVTEKYIMQYTSRNIRFFLIDYLKEKNIG